MSSWINGIWMKKDFLFIVYEIWEILEINHEKRTSLWAPLGDNYVWVTHFSLELA